jgi:methionyl-tRNA formyltransferase
MKIIYLGSGEFGIECLNGLLQSAHQIQLVITQPPAPAGRGQKTKKTPVGIWANEKQLPILETDNVNTPQVIDVIRKHPADIFVVIAFGQKISKNLIDMMPKGAVNVHASLLSKYRGAAPINWAIINGEKQTGVSIITLAEKMDAGDIIAQAETDITPDETAGQLHDKLAKIAVPLLIKALNSIEIDKAKFTPQDHSRATRAPKLKKSDGFIDFNVPAQVLCNKVRGLWPWPGATAEFTSKKTGKSCRVIIAQAQVVKTDNPEKLPVGTVDKDLNVICGQDAIKILSIKPAGGCIMNFTDFVNGRCCSSGDTFARVKE